MEAGAILWSRLEPAATSPQAWGRLQAPHCQSPACCTPNTSECASHPVFRGTEEGSSGLSFCRAFPLLPSLLVNLLASAPVPSGAPCLPALCLLSGEGINPLHLFPPQFPSLPGPVSLKLVASSCPKPILTRVRVRGPGMAALCGHHKRG